MGLKLKFLSLGIDADLLLRFDRNATSLCLSFEDAVSEALKEWCENREYLRTPAGEKRFPGAARSIKKHESEKS